MTVSMQLTKRIYAGNGLTRTWEVDFPLTSADDLQVFLTSPAGYETEINADYELNSDMDTLTYPTIDSGKDPLATGWKITLVRHTPSTQEIDLLRQGELDAEVLEQGYDKLTLISQELAEKLDRCIKYPVSTQPEDLETDTFLANILAAKQDAVTASTQAATAAQSAQQSAASATQTAQTALSDIATAKQSAIGDLNSLSQTIQETIAPSVTTAQTAAQTAQYYAEHTLGKQIGEVYYSQSASATDNRGALPLFTGETISSADTLYPEFYSWVSTHSELQISAANYETALSAYGECPKYVIDTENKTIRLPKLSHYIKMANTTDGITQQGAGLPNITGSTGIYISGGDGPAGAFYSSGSGNGGVNAIATGGKTLFDASLSNSIYGNSNTVTPTHTTLYPWVCAYNAAVAASTAQAAEFQQALSGKVDLTSSWGAISTTCDNLTEPNNNGYLEVTATADGWLYYGRKKAAGDSNTTMWALNTSHTEVFQLEHDGYWGGTLVSILCPVKKGETIRFGRNNLTGDFVGCRFYYAQKTN